ncbi:MAG: 50S ribosomal protein L21 [Sinomicrobium sp.]|nr:50S ribosomal protein L21 [Sinomicrobium sp.]
MYAIVEIAGQQFKVAKDQKVFVHRLAAEEGQKVTFDKVMLLDDDGKITVGAPAIDGAAVEAKVVKHLKGDKVIVFKKKRRKGYQVKNGHRQFLTELRIENIIGSGARKAAPAETERTGKKSPQLPAPEAKTAAPENVTTEEKKAPEKATPDKKAASEAEDLSKKTVAELKEMAKAKGISGIASMKKADLIAALSK